MVFVLLCLTSLSMIISRSIHFTAMARFYSFSWSESIPLHISSTYSLPIHLLIRYLSCFLVFGIVNTASVNIGLHVSIVIIAFSGFMPRSRLHDHMVTLFLVFLRNLHTVLHSGCTILHSHQLYRRVPFSSHSAAFICRPFNHGHSDRCEMVSYCGFDLHSRMTFFSFVFSLGGTNHLRQP